MGRRILDILSGAVLAIVAMVSWNALFRKQKIKQRCRNADSAASNHQPAGDSLPIANATGSKETQQPTDEQSCTGQYRGTERAKMNRPVSTRAEITLACIAGTAFVCSAIGLWVIYKTSDAAATTAGTASRQLTQMKESLEVDQRAWVSIEIPDFYGLLEGAEREAINSAFKNAGKTPAKIIKMRADFFWPTPPFKEKDFLDEIALLLADYGHSPPGSLSGAVIAPGNTNRYEIPLEPANEKILQKFQEHKAHLALISYVEYADVFGKKHSSWSLFVYNRDTEKLDRLPAYDHMD